MSQLVSAIALRLGILQPNFVAYPHQVAQRFNIDRGLPKDHLDLAAGHIVQLFSCIKQPVHNVWHRCLPRSWGSIALRWACNITLSLTWFAVMIAAATWMRFDVMPWELL